MQSLDMPSLLISIVFQLCRAVGYLHRNGVNHQDIKPGNILLDKSGALKLYDFGLSNYSKSANKTVRGTVEFMVPDMLLNGKISAASDIFCLAFVGRHEPLEDHADPV